MSSPEVIIQDERIVAVVDILDELGAAYVLHEASVAELRHTDGTLQLPPDGYGEIEDSEAFARDLLQETDFFNGVVRVVEARKNTVQWQSKLADAWWLLAEYTNQGSMAPLTDKTGGVVDTYIGDDEMQPKIYARVGGVEGRLVVGPPDMMAEEHYNEAGALTNPDLSVNVAYLYIWDGHECHKVDPKIEPDGSRNFAVIPFVEGVELPEA